MKRAREEYEICCGRILKSHKIFDLEYGIFAYKVDQDHMAITKYNIIDSRFKIIGTDYDPWDSANPEDYLLIINRLGIEMKSNDASIVIGMSEERQISYNNLYMREKENYDFIIEPDRLIKAPKLHISILSKKEDYIYAYTRLAHILVSDVCSTIIYELFRLIYADRNDYTIHNVRRRLS